MFNLVVWIKGKTVTYTKVFSVTTTSLGTLEFARFDDNNEVESIIYDSGKYDHMTIY